MPKVQIIRFIVVQRMVCKACKALAVSSTRIQYCSISIRGSERETTARARAACGAPALIEPRQVKPFETI